MRLPEPREDIASAAAHILCIICLRRSDITPMPRAHQPVHRNALLEQRREQIGCKVAFFSLADLLHNLRRDNIYSCIYGAGQRSLPCGLFGESGYPAAARKYDSAVFARVGGIREQNGDGTALLPMKLLRRRQIRIGHRIAADNEKRLAAAPKRLCLPHSSRSAERIALLKIAQLEPLSCRGDIFVALSCSYHIPEIARSQRRLGNAVTQQQTEYMLEGRDTVRLHERLRHRFGYRAKPCSLSARHNYSFHTVILSICSCSMPLYYLFFRIKIRHV